MRKQTTASALLNVLDKILFALAVPLCRVHASIIISNFPPKDPLE